MKRARDGDDESSELGEEDEEEKVKEEDQLEETSDIKKELEELLASIKTPGDFACGGHTELVLPGITVNNLGLLSVPLQDDTAEKLKKICSRAPFGRGIFYFAF